MNCRNSSTPTHRTWGWLKTGLLGAAFALFGTTQAQVDVTATAGTLSQSYTQLNLAFAAINAGTHQGVITIGISGNTTESASAVLNSGAVAPAAWTSMSITPTGAPYIIEGTIAGAVIKLNGADNVTIDGSHRWYGTQLDHPQQQYRRNNCGCLVGQRSGGQRLLRQYDPQLRDRMPHRQNPGPSRPMGS
ncbi:MAG: hypothetical protein IPH53_00530 [Flavobacteriales bacterium]|nr:hypothetical protein [Flavobacteriales bacterium]